jgi:hypothetical protein
LYFAVKSARFERCPHTANFAAPAGRSANAQLA